MTFSDYSVAARMRDAIKLIVEEVIEEMRPRTRYGTVISVDFATQRAHVYFEGMTPGTTVPIRYGSMEPSVGSIVRVDGNAGDKHVSNVVTGDLVRPSKLGLRSNQPTTGLWRLGPNAHFDSEFHISHYAADNPGASADTELAIRDDKLDYRSWHGNFHIAPSDTYGTEVSTTAPNFEFIKPISDYDRILAQVEGTEFLDGTSVTFDPTDNFKVVISGHTNSASRSWFTFRINDSASTLYRSFSILHDEAAVHVPYDGTISDLTYGRTVIQGNTFFVVALEFSSRGGLPVWTGKTTSAASASWLTGTTGGILREQQVPEKITIGNIGNATIDFVSLSITVTGATPKP